MEKDKIIFKINTILIIIITFIIFSLFGINEDSSWNIIPFLFSIVACFFLLITKKMVRKIITYGDKLKNNFYKFLYYFVLLPFLIIIGIFLVGGIIEIINILLSGANEFSEMLSQALLLLLLGITLLIGLIIPYINTILFLIIRLAFKNGKMK